MKKGNEKIELDSRPSDAISVALKNKSPIFITDNVLDSIKTKNIISKQHFPENKLNNLKKMNLVLIP